MLCQFKAHRVLCVVENNGNKLVDALECKLEALHRKRQQQRLYMSKQRQAAIRCGRSRKTTSAVYCVPSSACCFQDCRLCRAASCKVENQINKQRHLAQGSAGAVISIFAMTFATRLCHLAATESAPTGFGGTTLK